MFRVLAMLAALAALPALAQSPYPSRAIRMVVGYPPGSGVDLVPRLVGERLLAKWGHPLVVENRPGASGHIATEIVAKAPPDGYTLLTVPPAFATTPHLFATLPFDADAMVPVSVMVSQANVLVVPPARLSEVRTLQDLIEAAKARPGQLNYGSSGNGGSQHLSMELLKMLTGVQITHVPYKGVAVIGGFLAGDVDTGFFTVGGLLPHIKSGKLRALAVGGDRRNAALPEVPTLTELLPGMVSATWFAMIAPAKTPPEIVARLNAAVVEALQQPEVQKRLADIHADVIANSPERAAAFIREEKARWGKVIRAAGIKAD
jgi:tripartite-type tricarboxylate transporter receptor subunit TctC